MIKKVIGGYILGITHNINSINKQVIPNEGPVLIYSNHISRKDHLLISLFLKRNLYYVKGNIDTFEVDKYINNNEVILILGAKNKTNSYFSNTHVSVIKPDITVIPCAITGNYKIGDNLTVTFGDKLNLSGMTIDEIKIFLEQKIRELMLGRKDV